MSGPEAHIIETVITKKEFQEDLKKKKEKEKQEAETVPKTLEEIMEPNLFEDNHGFSIVGELYENNIIDDIGLVGKNILSVAGIKRIQRIDNDHYKIITINDDKWILEEWGNVEHLQDEAVLNEIN